MPEVLPRRPKGVLRDLLDTASRREEALDREVTHAGLQQPPDTHGDNSVEQNACGPRPGAQGGREPREHE